MGLFFWGGGGGKGGTFVNEEGWFPKSGFSTLPSRYTPSTPLPLNAVTLPILYLSMLSLSMTLWEEEGSHIFPKAAGLLDSLFL